MAHKYGSMDLDNFLSVLGDAGDTGSSYTRVNGGEERPHLGPLKKRRLHDTHNAQNSISNASNLSFSSFSPYRPDGRQYESENSHHNREAYGVDRYEPSRNSKLSHREEQRRKVTEQFYNNNNRTYHEVKDSRTHFSSGKKFNDLSKTGLKYESNSNISDYVPQTEVYGSLDDIQKERGTGTKTPFYEDSEGQIYYPTEKSVKNEKGVIKKENSDLKNELSSEQHEPVENEAGFQESNSPIQNMSTIGLSDILKIEHTVRNIQNYLKKLVDEAPNLAEFQKISHSDFTSEEDLMALKRNNNVKLAAHLKTMYDEGKLQIFDDIINFNSVSDFSSTFSTVSSALGLKDEKYLVSSNPEFQVDYDDSMVYDEKNLPPLPKIHDPSILARVFMHKSIINNKVYLNEREMVTSHNERLEFLGDSILNTVMTMIIYQRFEQLSEGDLSKIRTELINNNTLKDWALLYEFDKQLKKNVNENIIKRGSMKIYADVFEAYVGGLILEHGANLSVIKKWLQILAEPILRQYDREVNAIEPLDKSAKAELYALIGSASRPPIYITTSSGNGSTKPFVVKCSISNEELGVGIAPSLKEAGLRAAMNALKNKKLIEKYSRLRGETPRSQTVQKSVSLLRELDGNSILSEGNLITADKHYSDGERSLSSEKTKQSTYMNIMSNSLPPKPHNQDNTMPSLAFSHTLPTHQTHFDGEEQVAKNQHPYHEQIQSSRYQYSQYRHVPIPYSAQSSFNMEGPQRHLNYEQHAGTTSRGFDKAVSPARGLFPLYAQSSEEVDVSAKNTLYALLGKTRKVPIYRMESTEQGFKVELLVNNEVVAVSCDKNKKVASSRAAMTLLSNNDALRSLGVFSR